MPNEKANVPHKEAHWPHEEAQWPHKEVSESHKGSNVSLKEHMCLPIFTEFLRTKIAYKKSCKGVMTQCVCGGGLCSRHYK